MRPLTLDDMREVARARGGECLSKHYVNAHTPLRWRCAAGHKWEARPSYVTRGSWCLRCAGKAPKTIGDMRDIAHTRGGECLSRTYVNMQTPLRWRCAEGHVWETTPVSVSQGRWCPYCANRPPRTIDDMRELARARGGECLSKYYFNTNIHLRWRCAEGHVWEAMPANITKGTWCPHCFGNARLTIDDIRETARARGGECLSDTYSPSRPKLRWRCAAGHEWSANAIGVRCGRWCPRCRTIQRGTIERVRDVVVRKGGVLLDTKYRYSNTLLRVRCSAGHEWKARAGSLVNGTWCRECWIESLRGQSPARLTIRDMQQTAAARGGACLSEFYVNHYTRLRWRCHDGHEWDAPPSRIRSGHWCPRCARRYPGTIDGMRGLAVARGGVCLSDSYHNHRDLLQFRCARGHVFTATGMMVKSGVWCPSCAGRTSSSPARRAARARGRGCLR